jgi:hypothetical protein
MNISKAGYLDMDFIIEKKLRMCAKLAYNVYNSKPKEHNSKPKKIPPD